MAHSRRHKLKEMLARVGEKLRPSIKEERMSYESKGKKADKMREEVLKNRAKKGKNTLTAIEKAKLFTGPAESAFTREEQIKKIIKNR